MRAGRNAGFMLSSDKTIEVAYRVYNSYRAHVLNTLKATRNS